MKKLIVILKIATVLALIYSLVATYCFFADVKIWMSPVFFITIGMLLFYSAIISAEVFYNLKAKYYKAKTKRKLKNIK